MGINRRDWLKTAFLGGAALAFSPLEILAKQTPNYKELNNDGEAIRLCFNENPFGVSPKAIEAMQKSMTDASKYDFTSTFLSADDRILPYKFLGSYSKEAL